MMSTGHALSGMAVGYGASLLFQHITKIELHWVIPHAAAVVTAGWALWPDVDCHNATVTTSLGRVTKGVHHLIERACEAIYWATATEYDDNTPVIHRGATHTWPGALVMGLLVAMICAAYPRVGTPIILGISLHWAMRGLYMPTSPDKQLSQARLRGRNFVDQLGVIAYHRMGVLLKRRAVRVMRTVPLPGKYLRKVGRWGTFTACMAVAIFATEFTHALDTYWAGLLGIGAALGILTHMLGDSATESGVCWLFPFINPRSGKRWDPFQLPRWLAFKTGRAFEIGVMYPILIGSCVVAMPGGYALVLSVIAAWRDGYAAATALPFAPWLRKRPPTPVTPPLRCAPSARAHPRPPNRKPRWPRSMGTVRRKPTAPWRSLATHPPRRTPWSVRSWPGTSPAPTTCPPGPTATTPGTPMAACSPRVRSCGRPDRWCCARSMTATAATRPPPRRATRYQSISLVARWSCRPRPGSTSRSDGLCRLGQAGTRPPV